MRARRRAFSLMEVLLVLVITGIAAAMAVSRIDFSRYQADAVVQTIRATLEKAQRDAITRGHNVIVSFDTASGRIEVVWDANNNGAVDAGERVVWVPLERGNSFSVPSAGVNGAVTASIVGATLHTFNSMPSVTYRRDGSVSTDLEIYTATNGRRAAKIYRAITVFQATGRTAWYRRNDQNAQWVQAAL
ncbi:MAG TPA: GspH/FimT family pseudopilin [Gemmatimonadaceae bacterium]|nr:GspH/FimT family pseudopilin [Gemmatimonadaceae bacterium]